MKRIVSGALIVLSCLCGTAHAHFGAPWNHPPTIVVISVAGDPRLAMVDQAVAFWNGTLAQIGSGFRLGPVTRIVRPVPEEALQELGTAVADGYGGMNTPKVLRTLPGDITIVLARSEFASFTTFAGNGSKRIIGIREMDTPPMSLPNVALNVITHELGHALGLGHNSDPTTLMCGRPAWCRPSLFRSDTPHVFPLTDGERLELLEMYPATAKRKAIGQQTGAK